VLERDVEICGRDVRVFGDDSDEYVMGLPRRFEELALDCAGLVLAEDDVVLDVGANVGLMTIGFAVLAPRGRVVAVEPSPRTFPFLVRNVESAGLANVEEVQTAASDRSGTVAFVDSSWFSAGSFVKNATMASDIHGAGVSVRAEPIDQIVDELGLDRVDFLKLDVEGHELPALQGAHATLKRFEPLSVIELNLFTTTSFGKTLPADFLAAVRGTFPYVYEYDTVEGGGLIGNDHDAYQCIMRKFMSGRTSELICGFAPLPPHVHEGLQQRADARRAAVAAASAANTAFAADLRGELAARQAELASARDDLAVAQGDLASARGDLEALRASTSWRVTAPARKLSERVRRILR
jgi:FkbM family methyltransferase